MKAPGILLIILLVCASSCGFGGRDLSKIIARVGESEISDKDVEYRITIEKAYGNETMTDAVALVVLVNDVLEREVGRICGVTASTKELAALSKHAEETSKAPEILAKVKEACGSDRNAYERLFLAPRIINQKLRAWYSRSSDIHERERSLIEKAYSLVQSGEAMEEAAEERGLIYSIVEHGKDGGEMPNLFKEHFPEGGDAFIDPLIEILETLSDGEVYRNIVEDDHGYKVIRLLEKKRSQYKVETITARKRSFDQWFHGQGAEVEVKVLDRKLEKEIASKYPNLGWVKRWISQKQD